MQRLPLKGTGAFVTPLSSSEVQSRIMGSVSMSRGLRIANLNTHGLKMFLENRAFREYTRSADVSLIDGMPILIFAAIANRKLIPASKRIGSTDWLFPLLHEKTGLRIVAIGGTMESARSARANVLNMPGDVEWEAFEGYTLRHVTEGSELHIADAIKDAHLVLVGMGMPKQEEWIQLNADALVDKVVANVGGCIDYIAGVQPLAPRWLGRIGAEWLFRLAMNPRRLAHRYLVEPLSLALAIFKNRRHSTVESSAETRER
jgi:N-acetylglucosaminyldiphosphoundecaprenol N-acetyl-beta-D-mannosaminyltransferase